MPASKAGDNTSVTWPTDMTVSVARDKDTKTQNATYGMSMMLRPALTEALKDAAQHVSRVGTLEEDLHVCLHACSCLQPLPMSSPMRDTHQAVRTRTSRQQWKPSTARQKPHETDSICKSATDLPGAKVITLGRGNRYPHHDLRAEGRSGGTRRGVGHCRSLARLTCCPVREG